MKRITLYPVLTLLMAIVVNNAFAQPQPYPNTLLWRISGKDLTKPSYLFGTMHLQDRRIFQFSDSLYYFLEHTDGYAMEVNPDEAVAAFLQALNEPDTSDYVFKDVQKDDYQKVAKDLETRFGVPANKITRRQYWLYKQSWQNRTKAKDDDMDAAVDMYLYNIARRQGKWVGGIEDIEDQFGLMQKLGEKLNIEELIVRKKTSSSPLEAFIKAYAAQDLNQLDAWISSWDATEKDLVLLKRNKKMAYRIDSMAHVRSHFFAVGAAHLLGTEGLINLLTQKGYTVAPVLSKKRLAPEAYHYTAVDLPWLPQENEEKSYQIDMPGKAITFSPYGEALKMKIYADMGIGLIYFITSVEVPANKNRDSLLAKYTANFTRNNKQAKFIAINFKGMEGREAVSTTNGYQYRTRLFLSGNQLVMAMVGAQKKALLYHPEAERFYQSLVIKEFVKPAAAGKDWYTYSNREQTFELAFPTKPVANKELTETARKSNNTGWNVINQTCLDLTHQMYYMLIVKETKPGYYIQSDEIIFDDIKKNMQSNPEVTVTETERTTFNGQPCLWLNGTYNDQGFLMKSLHVNNANRSFSLMVMYDKTQADTAYIHRFFNSFRFLSPAGKDWQPVTDSAHLFTTYAPAPFRKKEGEDTTAKFTTLLSHDPVSGFSFYVEKSAIDPYFWSPNDSAFYAEKIAGYVGAEDSLLSAAPVANGAAHGREFLVRLGKEGRNVEKVRLFLRGDSTYALYTIMPPAYMGTPEFQRFFTGFTFKGNSKPSTVFTNKAQKLLHDIDGSDSIIKEAAQSYWNNAPFTKTDLPLLHQALLQPFSDFSVETYCNHDRVLNTVMHMADESTVDFIRSHYPLLKSEQEKLKYPLLKLLAGIKTKNSYMLLKELLGTGLPKEGKPIGLARYLTDSLPLLQTIYPQLLPLVANDTFSDVIATISNELLDSSLIKLDMLAPYQAQFLNTAHIRYNLLKSTGTVAAWDYYNWVHLMSKFNNRESNALLQQVVQLNDIGIKRLAIVKLLKNGQTVNPQYIEQVAADKSYRITLYEDLKNEEKLSLFPAKYANQKSLSESELYNYSSDDMEPSKIEYIGDRTATHMGRKQKFYLFKVTYTYDDGTAGSYLGIAGGYALNSKQLTTASSVIGFAEDEFDSKQLDQQFKAFLQQQENSPLSTEEDN